MWLVRHAFAIAVLPVTAAALVPLWVARRYEVSPAIPAHAGEWLLAVLGVALFAAGAALFVSTVYLFATEGRGTLAPWDPPSRLVVRGPYRYVRNPMISGVLFIIAAEALVLRSWPHAIWAAAFLAINAIYIPAFEEKQLEDRFGDDYRFYKKNVRRFLPRATPFTGGGSARPQG